MDPRPLRKGAWLEGYSLDVQTKSSVYLGDDGSGHPRFDTTRSEIGEQLYQLKYHDNRVHVESLAMVAAKFIKEWKIGIDVIVPVPASKHRAMQPVPAIGQRVAAILKIPFDSVSVKRTKKALELKSIDDPEERAKAVDGAFRVEGENLSDKRVLLFDDLFRSGVTVEEIAKIVLAAGAKDVRVLALTRTRTKS